MVAPALHAARRCASAAAGAPPGASLRTVALEGRRLLRLEGDDVFKYLQGLVTADVRRLEAGASGAAPPQPLYTALLSHAGRVLYDAFLHPLPGGGGGAPALLADVSADSAAQMQAHLERYRLRAKVQLADASAEWAVWARVPPAPPSPHDAAPAPPPPPDAPEPDAAAAAEGWRRDPRLAALGWRAVLPRGAAPAGARAAEDAYVALRLALGVAEGAELAGELPLELNLDGLGAISFAKGCYVGQELTSRTHFRGVVRKRALPLSLGGAFAADAARGAAVLPAAGGAPVGRLLAAQGGRGVALLRVAAALPAHATEAPPQQLVLEGGATAAPLRVWRPHWWPPAWGTEA